MVPSDWTEQAETAAETRGRAEAPHEKGPLLAEEKVNRKMRRPWVGPSGLSLMAMVILT